MTQLPALYRPKTTPFPHQLAALRASYNKRVFALFMEQGTGKTKVALDTACLMYEAGHIEGLVVVAPNDVHRQWVTEQVPAHVPERIKVRTAVWSAGSQREGRACEVLATRKWLDHLAILAINIDALSTPRGRRLLTTFLKTYKALFVLDESHYIKTPNATRTKGAILLSKGAFARRILTGTPVTQSPFDLFAQFKFLDPRIIGIDSFLAFKHRYGVWEKETVRRAGKVVQFESLVEHRNVDELYGRIEAYTYKVRKEDCLDLPPKSYMRHPVHLSKAQVELYDALVDSALVLLDNPRAGERLVARAVETMHEDDLCTELTTPDLSARMSYKVKLTLMLRLQQIVGGFATTEGGDTYPVDGSFAKTPRAAVTLEVIEQALLGGHKVIVWARFREELLALHALLSPLSPTVRVDGSIPRSRRGEIFDAFKAQGGATRILVAHQRTAGTGFNFTIARDCYFYSNAYSYSDRAQAEDRIHRIGTTGTVTMHDPYALACPVDTEILAAIEKKRSFADALYAWSPQDFAQQLRRPRA